MPLGLVHRCHDARSFIAGVESALESRDSAAERRARDARRSFARSRSWDSRLDQMLDTAHRVANEKNIVLQ